MKKQKYNIIILVLVSLIVAYFILKDDFINIIDVISKVNIWWVIFSCLLVIVSWYFQALSLSALSSTTGRRFPFLKMLKSMIICNFFSAITPSSTGGQPFQVYYLKKSGVDLGTATNLVVEQSTLYQIALVALSFVALAVNSFYNIFPSDNILKRFVIIGFIVNFIVIVVLLFICFGKKSNKYIILKFFSFLHKIGIIKDKEKIMSKVEKTIDNFYISAHSLNHNKSVLIQGAIYNLLGLIFLYMTPLAVAYSLGEFTSLNIMLTIVVSTYVMLIGAFVPIPGGSGGIELAFASFFGGFITGPTLMAMLLIWRFSTYYFTILVGGLVLIVGGRGKNEDRLIY